MYRRQSDYAEQLVALFEEAVGDRVRDRDVVWTELSGGLDSSSVTCMAQRLVGPGQLRAVTYVTEGSTDSPFIAEVERAIGLNSVKLLDHLYPYLHADLSSQPVPAWWQARFEAIRALMETTGSKLLITGQLGDLVMSNFADDSEQVADCFREGQILAGLTEAFTWSRQLRCPVYSILRRAASSATPPPVNGGLSGNGDRSRTEDSLSPALKRRALERRYASQRPEWCDLPPTCRKRAFAIQEMLDSRRLQCPAALAGMDVTHPFSDRRLVEFTLRTPARVTCGPGEPRKLMREAFRSFLPPAIANRRNKASYREACMRAIEPLARQMLSDGSTPLVVELGYVNPHSLRNRLSRMLNGLATNETQLRQIILFEFWLRSRPAAAGVVRPAERVHAAM
jgi:asparagine synthase (glutamine-hydrolysing)